MKAPLVLSSAPSIRVNETLIDEGLKMHNQPDEPLPWFLLPGAGASKLMKSKINIQGNQMMELEEI